MRKHGPEALELLTKVAPDLDGTPDPRQRARDLTRILAQPRRQATRAPERTARVRRPVAWTTAVGVTAIATAVAVATLVPSGPGTNGSQPGPEQVLAAKQVLLAVARQAEVQPATTGRWWHTQRRHSSTIPFPAGQGHEAFLLVMEGAIANWSPAHGRQAWEGGTKPYYRFPTPEDEANWRRAGEPFKPGSGDRRPGWVQRHRDPRVLEQPPTPQFRIPGPAFWVLGNRTGMTVRDVQRLPATPAALRQRLLRVAERDGARTPADKAQWLWVETPNMLFEWPLTPRTRAAAYRMLADLPGIRSIGRVTDPLGRPGVAVARTGRDYGFGTVERQLIFDPDTSAFLATQTILRTPAARTATGRPGTRLGYGALVTAGWVDQLPRPPARVAGP